MSEHATITPCPTEPTERVHVEFKHAKTPHVFPVCWKTEALTELGTQIAAWERRRRL